MNLGKSIIQDATPFLDYVPADVEDHQSWPVDKKFKISYRVKSDDTAFGNTIHTYLNSDEEVKLWKAQAARWVGLGRNTVEYILYEWDMGPKVVGHDVI